jgi:hypothetical protein
MVAGPGRPLPGLLACVGVRQCMVRRISQC